MKRKNEKGEVVVEASIIVTIVIIFITLMLYIGMILYQKTLTTVMANQTASNIAQVYSNNLKDPFTGYIDPNRIYQSITYSNIKTDAYMDIMNQKANALGQYRLKSSRILGSGTPTIEVDIVKKPKDLLKSQIVVTVYDRYEVPLVGLFGVDNGVVEFSAIGRADCVDVLEYMNGVEAIGGAPDPTPEDERLGNIPGITESDTCLVTFFTDKHSKGFHAAVPVLRGKSIITSNRYSHSTMPESPLYNEMEFTGWVKEDGTAFTASQQIDENITVYGSWLCEVTFAPEGGTVKPTSKKVKFMGTTEFPIPERDSYDFQGWFTETNGKGVPYISKVTEITGNITLYAKWKCNHKYLDYAKGTEVQPGTCIQNSKWEYPCKQCGTKVAKIGSLGDCNYEGRCGQFHPIEDGGKKIESHRGKNYEVTTKGECIICTECGGPRDGMTRADDGKMRSVAIYCREHKETSGKISADDSQWMEEWRLRQAAFHN